MTIPTPISEEANDDDHETSDQVTTEPRRSTRVKSAPEWYAILFCRSCYLTMTNLRTTRKRWWAQIPWNGLRPWNLRWDPCMRTKYGLWLTCPMIGESLRINGSSRGRRTLIVVLLSTKLELSQKGFRQVQGVDYDKIFSFVVMLKFVWIMLAIATFYEIWQMDVKTAFLNGFIKEELYMMQPESFCQS